MTAHGKVKMHDPALERMYARWNERAAEDRARREAESEARAAKRMTPTKKTLRTTCQRYGHPLRFYPHSPYGACPECRKIDRERAKRCATSAMLIQT